MKEALEVIIRFWGILVLISFLWTALENIIYGYSTIRVVDFIMAALFSAYVSWRW